MNRSILIIICDFLLVTLVAFSSFEEKPSQQAQSLSANVPQPTEDSKEVVGTLKLALEDEKQTREKLTQDLQAQEKALSEREQKLKEYQENLRRSEEQARQIEQQRTALAQQVQASTESRKE